MTVQIFNSKRYNTVEKTTFRFRTLSVARNNVAKTLCKYVQLHKMKKRNLEKAAFPFKTRFVTRNNVAKKILNMFSVTR